MNTDTPLPPEEPAGQNPPDGATIDYWLKSPAQGPVVLEVLDAGGQLVRRYRSDDPEEAPVPGRNIPDYWIRPPQRLATGAGLHRFVWDLRYPTPDVLQFGYPIAAVYRNTPREPQGSWALPGTYTVRLTVDGRTWTQPLVVRMDPRVTATPADLQAQFRAARRLSDALGRDVEAIAKVRASRQALARQPAGVSRHALDTALAAFENGEDSFQRLNGQLARLLGDVEDVDAAPTPQQLAAADAAIARLDARIAALQDLAARVGGTGASAPK